jgi:hypothetical protein
MDQEFKQYLDGKFAELDGKFATRRELERVETALFTELRKAASPAELRARTHAAVLRAIDFTVLN